MAKETIVVVDDEAFARNAVAKILNANGYKVHALPGGQEAINFAMSEQFDVLLTDFRMPGGLDGLTTIRAVQRIHPQLVAIIMTANTTLDLAVQSLNLGVHGFVVKPFTSHELLKTIQQTLERQKLLRENSRLRTLMDVYVTTEALITAKTDQSQLPHLTVALALSETSSDEALLFIQDEASKELNLVAVGVIPHDSLGSLNQQGYSDRPERLSELLQRYTFPDSTRYAFAHTDLMTELAKMSPEVVRELNQIIEVDGMRVSLEALQSLPLQGHASLMVVPMKVQGRAIGMLCIRRLNSEYNFSEVDLQTLSLLASQAAIAFENARLFTSLARIEALREADRLRREFVSTVSHELRTPLTSIKGYATTLLREDVSWNAQVGQEYLGIISEECDKLMELIDNILEVSKIEAGGFKVHPEPVQIKEILNRAISDTHQRYPGLKLMLALPVDEEMPYVMGDPRRIIQVMRNLISNAIKYSPDGSPLTISLKYGSNQVDSPDIVEVSVQDKGIGLKNEDLERVFERFYRVDNGPARLTEGTGLGLAICRGIIEAHKGRIWVESEGLGKGSKFIFTLPVVALSGNSWAD